MLRSSGRTIYQMSGWMRLLVLEKSCFGMFVRFWKRQSPLGRVKPRNEGCGTALPTREIQSSSQDEIGALIDGIVGCPTEILEIDHEDSLFSPRILLPSQRICLNNKLDSRKIALSKLRRQTVDQTIQSQPASSLVPSPLVS